MSDALGVLGLTTDLALSGVAGTVGAFAAVVAFVGSLLDSIVSVEAFLSLPTVGVTIVVVIERSTSRANTGFAPKADNSTAVDAKKNLLFFI